MSAPGIQPQTYSDERPARAGERTRLACIRGRLGPEGWPDRAFRRDGETGTPEACGPRSEGGLPTVSRRYSRLPVCATQAPPGERLRLAGSGGRLGPEGWEKGAFRRDAEKGTPEACGPRSRPWLLALGLLLSLATAQAAPEAAEPVAEYQLKAAVLVNLAKFVEWPSNAFDGPSAPLVIGVVGQDPFGRWLDEAAQSQSCAGHPFEVHRFTASDPMPPAQVLFISRSEQKRLAKLLEAVQGQPRLTVSDLPGFAAQGGMVGLVLREGMVRFEVNLATIQTAGLRLSSKVSKYATVVGPVPAQPGKS